jgi:hypothetical protein
MSGTATGPPLVIPDNKPSRQAEFIGTTVFLTAFATFFILARFYTRIFNSKSFGWDDACLAVALVSLCNEISMLGHSDRSSQAAGWVSEGIIIKQAELGLGVTFNENLVKRPQDLVPLLKFIQVSIFTNGIEMCLLKVGIGISLLRLRLSKTFDYAVYGCIVLSLLVNLIVIPGFFGQCRPMARLWDKTIPGTCWTPTYSLASSYVQTGNSLPLHSKIQDF